VIGLGYVDLSKSDVEIQFRQTTAETDPHVRYFLAAAQSLFSSVPRVAEIIYSTVSLLVEL
jgi:hypothetical protein